MLIQPVWSGVPKQQSEWQIRGRQARIADGGGRFRFVGLPSGSYRLRAARPGAGSSVWLADGVAVETGDEAVVVVLPEVGQAHGKVLYSDGSAPSSFSIAVGASAATPFTSTDGSFVVSVPSGPQYVRVSGPGFSQKILQVSIDGRSDVGTITVKRGRLSSPTLLVLTIRTSLW